MCALLGVVLAALSRNKINHKMCIRMQPTVQNGQFCSGIRDIVRTIHAIINKYASVVESSIDCAVPK